MREQAQAAGAGPQWGRRDLSPRFGHLQERVEPEAQKEVIPLSLLPPWVSGRKKRHKVRASWLDQWPPHGSGTAAVSDTWPFLPNGAS